MQKESEFLSAFRDFHDCKVLDDTSISIAHSDATQRNLHYLFDGILSAEIIRDLKVAPGYERYLSYLWGFIRRYQVFTELYNRREKNVTKYIQQENKSHTLFFSEFYLPSDQELESLGHIFTRRMDLTISVAKEGGSYNAYSIDSIVIFDKEKYVHKNPLETELVQSYLDLGYVMVGRTVDVILSETQVATALLFTKTVDLSEFPIPPNVLLQMYGLSPTKSKKNYH